MQMIVSSESWRQTFVDNGAEEDRERYELDVVKYTTWKTSCSIWRTQGILINGEGELVSLIPYLRNSQLID